MSPAAASPEELDTLLEDALLLDDSRALAAVFAAAEVVVVEPDGVRRGAPAARFLAGRGYLGVRPAVRLRQGVAVVVGDSSVTVSCRCADGGWRLLAVVIQQTG